LRWACAPELCPELRDKGFDARPAGVYELDPSPLRHPPPEIAAALSPGQRPARLFHLVFGPTSVQDSLRRLTAPCRLGASPRALSVGRSRRDGLE